MATAEWSHRPVGASSALLCFGVCRLRAPVKSKGTELRLIENGGRLLRTRIAWHCVWQARNLLSASFGFSFQLMTSYYCKLSLETICSETGRTWSTMLAQSIASN